MDYTFVDSHRFVEFSSSFVFVSPRESRKVPWPWVLTKIMMLVGDRTTSSIKMGPVGLRANALGGALSRLAAARAWRQLLVVAWSWL